VTADAVLALPDLKTLFDESRINFRGSGVLSLNGRSEGRNGKGAERQNGGTERQFEPT
jgi:hypothetical protein